MPNRQLGRTTARTLLGVIMAVPVMLTLVASRLGPGISPDSVHYAATARAFAANGSLTTYTGRPLTIFPPGLPVVLGLAQRLGVDVQVAAVALNVLCVAACVLLCYLLAEVVLPSNAWALAFAGWFALSLSTTQVFSMLWTEPLFTTATLAALVLLVRAVNDGSVTSRVLIGVSAAVSLACAVRFIGIVLIPVAGLGVLWASGGPRGTRARRSALRAMALSSIGLLIVAARNVSLGVPPLGSRSPSGVSLGAVLAKVSETVGRYGVPAATAPAWAHALVTGVVVLLLGTGVWCAFRQRRAALMLVAVFTLGYWIALVYGQFATTIDPIDLRLTEPVFPAMLVLGAYGLQQLLSGVTGARGRPAVVTSVAVLLVASTAANAWLAMGHSLSAANEGVGYNSRSWRTSSLGRALSLLPGGTVAASDAAAAYWVSGLTPVQQLPQRHDRVLTRQGDLRSVEAVIYGGSIRYVAFFRTDSNALTPQQMSSLGIPLSPLVVTSDGTLYQVVGHA